MLASIVITLFSFFRIFFPFLVTKFLFLELLPTDPASSFLDIRDHSFARLLHW